MPRSKISDEKEKKIFGGTNYSKNEVMSLLYVIKEIKPISSYEWAIMVNEHARKFQDKTRDKESIRRKFRSLKSSKAPTGDPSFPEEVRLAKTPMRDMTQKAEIQDGDDDEEDLETLQITLDSSSRVIDIASDVSNLEKKMSL